MTTEMTVYIIWGFLILGMITSVITLAIVLYELLYNRDDEA